MDNTNTTVSNLTQGLSMIKIHMDVLGSTVGGFEETIRADKELLDAAIAHINESTKAEQTLLSEYVRLKQESSDTNNRINELSGIIKGDVAQASTKAPLFM